MLNTSTQEFDVPADGFPIAVLDVPSQLEAIATVLTAEIGGPAELLVLPELSGHPDAIAPAAAMLEAHLGNAVVALGTYHEDLNGTQRNVCHLVMPSGDTEEFVKRTPLWNIDVRENIDPCHDAIKVIVTADVRLTVLICKDFLTQGILDVVAHVGTNLVIVPSMSRRLDLHDVAARQLAARSHALSVIANGPQAFVDVATGVATEPHNAMLGRAEANPAATVVSGRGMPPRSAVRINVITGAITTAP